MAIQLPGHINEINQAFINLTLSFINAGYKKYKKNFLAISNLIKDSMFEKDMSKQIDILREVLEKLKCLKLIVIEVKPDDLECTNKLISHLQHLIVAFSRSEA